MYCRKKDIAAIIYFCLSEASKSHQIHYLSIDGFNKSIYARKQHKYLHGETKMWQISTLNE